MEKKNYMAPQSRVIEMDMPPFCANPASVSVDQTGNTTRPLSRDEEFIPDGSSNAASDSE